MPEPFEHGTATAYSYHHCRCDRCRAAIREYQRSRRNPDAVPDGQHGTPNAYSNYGCRCEVCRTQHAARIGIARERRLAKPVPDRVHGSTNGYQNYGCRCEACGTAQRESNRRRHGEG